MVSRCTAKSASRDIRSLRGRLLDGPGRRRRYIRNALMRRSIPLAAEEIAPCLRIEMIVTHRIPGTKRRVVIADTRHMKIVGVNTGRADDGPFTRRTATRESPGRYSANQNQTDASAPFHQELRVSRLQPSIAAATMMHMPRITAAATMEAATFLFSTISLCRSPGVHLSNVL